MTAALPHAPDAATTSPLASAELSAGPRDTAPDARIAPLSATANAYPGGQSVDVSLRDGSSVHVRSVRAEDRDAIRVFLGSLSSDSIGFRFFGAVDLDWASRWSVDVDYADRYGLVVTAGPDAAIMAHAVYVREDADRAEVAFAVADALRGMGIASILLAHLAAAANAHGITIFTAVVLPSNHRMIEVFRDSGFPVKVRATSGEIHVELPTSLSEETRQAFERREMTSAVAAVRSFLAPSAIAVIGSAWAPHTVGAELVRNLVHAGFTGALYPVGCHGRTLQGHRAYASMLDLPEPVELAVVTVAADEVAEVARACGSAGARALLVTSPGFGQADESGSDRQRELLEICRDTGMRLLGPDCRGVINTDSEVQLDATFTGHSPPAGRVGLLSQGGGLGIALVDAAGRLGLGVSTFMSLGNKTDISGNDVLEYWEQDPATDIVLLYLESFGNPRRFAQIGRRVSRVKPIIAVKSGRTPAARGGSSSRTRALVAASDATVDALFDQSGVIRTDTVHEMLDAARLLSAQPPPRGARVVIVSNDTGLGAVCADACAAGGLDVARLPEETRRSLADSVGPETAVSNPVHMVADATADDYRRTIEVLVHTGAGDAIIALFVPSVATGGAEVAREIHAAAQDARGITLASVLMDRGAAPVDSARSDIRVAQFEFPEDAATALAHAARYQRWRTRPPGTVSQPESCRPGEAAAVIAQALAVGGGWLDPDQVAALLNCYGLPLIATRVVHGARAAVAAAGELGGPVAVKVYASELPRKRTVAGVHLRLLGEDAVRGAASAIRRAIAQADHHLDGLIVQPMAEPGVELVLGVIHDESFGPVLACSAGGPSDDQPRDVAVRIMPVSDLDATEMLRSLDSFPTLSGNVGNTPCDLQAVENVLLRLSALVDAHPEIAEVDIHPLIARPDGAEILDAHVRVRHPPPPQPMFSLRNEWAAAG